MQVLIPADPEAISIDLDRTALVVVDMQNAFASRGGMLDLSGVDMAPARDAVANARLVCEAARSVGVPVIYLTIGYPETVRLPAARIRRILTRSWRSA